MVALARPPSDDLVYLHGDWARYEQIVEERGDESAPRIAFLDEAIELMSPTHFHEGIKSLLGRFAEAWCMARRIPFTPYGAWTLKKRRRRAAAEPDECYVFRSRAALKNPQRPDLAIEVFWSRRQINKVEIYRRLEVRELWIWEKGRMTVHVLRNGKYVERSRSNVLPGIDLLKMAELAEIRPASDAILAFQRSLRRNRSRRR